MTMSLILLSTQYAEKCNILDWEPKMKFSKTTATDPDLKNKIR